MVCGEELRNILFIRHSFHVSYYIAYLFADLSQANNVARYLSEPLDLLSDQLSLDEGDEVAIQRVSMSCLVVQLFRLLFCVIQLLKDQVQAMVYTYCRRFDVL